MIHPVIINSQGKTTIQPWTMRRFLANIYVDMQELKDVGFNVILKRNDNTSGK